MDDYKFMELLETCGWKRDSRLPEFYVKKWSEESVTRRKYSTVMIGAGVIKIRTNGLPSLTLNTEYNVDCTSYEQALAVLFKIQSHFLGTNSKAE